MSEVKFYHLFTGQLVEGRGGLGHVSVVLSADHDRVTAERDALQERLNAADQKDDDLSFQLSDREASRYDWLRAAQAAEKECERLREERDSFQRVGIQTMQQLAERDALLRKLDDAWNSHDGKERFGKLMQRVEALSASAEPSDYLKSCEAAHRALSLEPAAPVERDERADLENHPRFKGMDFTRAPQHPDYYDSPYANGCWHGWQARAALDKATEGGAHEK